MNKITLRFSALAVTLLAIGWNGSFALGFTEWEELRPAETIQRNTYKTWSIFLVCNQDWVAAEKSKDITNLYRRAKSFGDAIGSKNLAVWFSRRAATNNGPHLSENIDVARSAEFCRALGLTPSKGPYLVVTNEYPGSPDPATFPKERATYKFGGMQSADIAKTLSNLTDQLLLYGHVDTGSGSTPATSSTSLWIRLLESTRQGVIGLGCSVKLQITTSLLTAELRSCPGQ